MPFENGNKLSSGRPAGTPNRSTAEAREKFNQLLADHYEQLYADFAEMSPRWRVHYLLELAKFVLPTLKAIDIKPDLIEEPRIFTVNIVKGTDSEYTAA